jgi:hypothetical protein
MIWDKPRDWISLHTMWDFIIILLCYACFLETHSELFDTELHVYLDI